MTTGVGAGAPPAWVVSRSAATTAVAPVASMTKPRPISERLQPSLMNFALLPLAPAPAARRPVTPGREPPPPGLESQAPRSDRRSALPLLRWGCGRRVSCTAGAATGEPRGEARARNPGRRAGCARLSPWTRRRCGMREAVTSMSPTRSWAMARSSSSWSAAGSSRIWTSRGRGLLLGSSAALRSSLA